MINKVKWFWNTHKETIKKNLIWYVEGFVVGFLASVSGLATISYIINNKVKEN